MIPQSIVKIHLLDCKCQDCERPVVLGSTTCWLREYTWDMPYYSWSRDPRFKIHLRPRDLVPDMTLHVNTHMGFIGESDSVNATLRAQSELEVVLRTHVRNPLRDRRDILRFLAYPFAWKPLSTNPQHYSGACLPYWKVDCEGGTTLNLFDIFTADLDTVLKVCARPLEILLASQKGATRHGQPIHPRSPGPNHS